MRISRSNYLTFLDKSNGQDGRLHNGPQQCTGTSAPRKLWRSVGECGPNFAAFRSCPRCVTAQRLTFLDPVAACGAQGWGPLGISPSQRIRIPLDSWSTLESVRCSLNSQHGALGIHSLGLDEQHLGFQEFRMS